MRVFNVRCTKDMATALAVVVDAEREAEQAWWKARREALDKRAAAEDLSAADRARLADALAAQFARLREAGELRGTRTAVVLPAVREVLAERGWLDRRWRPVPPTRGGRPWGTHDAQYDARVTLYLPDDVGELLARACYWASQPAVQRLQEWYDRHGDHWRGTLHNAEARWSGRGPSHADLAERERLIRDVQTTGRVLREAISRTLEMAER